MFGEPNGGTPSIISWAPGSVKADTRIGDGHGDVGDQVPEHRQHSRRSRVGQQDGVVEVLQGVVEEQPEPG
jgi:hypothetical protein